MEPMSGETRPDEPATAEVTPEEPVGEPTAASEGEPAEIGWRGAGSIIGRSLDRFGSAFPLFLALGTPVAIFSAVTIAAGTNLMAAIVASILTAMTAVVTGAAMMFATDDLGRGVRPGFGDVLDRAAGRAIPLVLASLVVATVLAGLMAVIGIVLVALRLVLGPDSVIVMGVAIAAVILIAVFVATVLAVRWSLSGQAVVLDGLGPLAGLNRGRQLTRGHAWRLVGLFFALGLFTVLASAGASLLSTYAPNRAFAAVGLAIATLVTSPLLAIALAVAYRDLAGRPAGAGAGAGLPRGSGRRTGVIAVFGGGLMVFAAGIWAVTSAGGQVFLPERGQVIAGTSQNALDPCHPNGVKTTFDSTEEIWIAAIFTKGVPPGDDVVVEYGLDGVSLGTASLQAGAEGLECYYEFDPVVGAQPGTYRITVTLGSAVLADGSFTVR